jgi:hypothetical protein
MGLVDGRATECWLLCFLLICVLVSVAVRLIWFI